MIIVKKQFKRGPKKGFARERDSEFDQKMIDLRRVARVVKGGRRFSFRATLVVGNKKGRVGIGLGKGADTTIAIEKAVRQAKKSLVRVPINKNGSVPHEALGRFGSARVLLRPAGQGKGLVAGSSARVILELAGVKNSTAKTLSKTKNKLNNALATINAIQQLKATGTDKKASSNAEKNKDENNAKEDNKENNKK